MTTRPRLPLLAVSFLLALATTAAAEVKLPSLFASHMVLQRDRAAPIWGTAAAGETVHVLLGKQLAKVKADDAGKWRAELRPQPAGGPHTIVIEGADSRIQIDDVYFGEVWICSGQSNMAWSVSRSTNAETEIAAADWPKIRFFKVPLVPAAEPQDDCAGRWYVCGPKTVADLSAVGYFFGRELHKELDVPIGMLQTSWGGTLAEAWTSREALEAKENLKPILERIETVKGDQNRASHLYNGMLHMLIPYGIRGAIWYQGESNVTRAEQYATLFPTMIGDWRARWGQGDFPFYFVQLAPFHYNGQPEPDFLAEQWDSQLKTHRSVPNTGIAVTTDIATLGDIHPPNKQDVGKRLALWALARDYGRSGLVYSGPLYRSHETEDGKIRIRFDHAGRGLSSRDGQPLTEFTVAGADQKFVPAEAQIDGDSIIVWSEEIAAPAAVRFGWRNVAQPNLMNKDGLPASPFRTDDWPLKTAGQY